MNNLKIYKEHKGAVYQKEYRKKNKERIRERRKEYWKKNKEKIRERRKEYQRGY